jgi:predicted acyl esterase
MGGMVVDQGSRGGYTSEGRWSEIKSSEVCVVIELLVPG